MDAVEAFSHACRKTGGNGIIALLPCGSGKTIIGLGVIASISNHTLIVTTNNVSVHQWRHELLSKTLLSSNDIGEYTGIEKEILPITITTYQMLTHRKSKQEPMKNLEIFTEHNWGLIIDDEVHFLPAPVFRATTDKRRLGLTPTLVIEDGKEDDVRENYSQREVKFLEGRLSFLALLKPILNGRGFDSKEPTVADERRMDIVITYQYKRYVIELKLWYGEKYH